VPPEKKGSMSSTWVLMDYGDVIVHVFSKGKTVCSMILRGSGETEKIVESVDEL